MIDMFRNGGYGMFPTLLFGVVLVLVAARYASAPEARLVPLQVALGVVTLASGALGFVAGLITTAKALERVPREEASVIGALGFGESLNNVALALGLIVLAALAASVGAGRLAWVAGGAP